MEKDASIFYGAFAEKSFHPYAFLWCPAVLRGFCHIFPSKKLGSLQHLVFLFGDVFQMDRLILPHLYSETHGLR